MAWLVRGQRRTHILAAAALLVVLLVACRDFVLSSHPVVPGTTQEDMFKQFTYWRDFGFRELSRGNLPLWNPHIFCGCPYVGGFQSAMFYPPNLAFLVLPLATAINFSILLHLYLLGLFTYLWAVRRGLHPLGGFLGGSMLMLCGAVFPRLVPGHLPHLCAMAWAPLVFLIIDALFERPTPWRCLWGALIVALQITAGHPQFFFITTVAAGLYCLARLVVATNRWKVAPCVAAMYTLAVALAAVQLLTCADETGETLRSGSVPYTMAAQYSFPPENLLLLLAPSLLGGPPPLPYWGRWFPWEVGPFVSVTGLVLAFYGALWGRGRWRYLAVTMVAVLLLLALGGYTPLLALLHRFVPGFDKFRCNGRFLFPMSLFLAMLAAVGLDAMIRDRRGSRRVAGALAVLAVGLLGVALALRSGSDSPSSGPWGMVMEFMKHQATKTVRECWITLHCFDDPAFARDTARQAAVSLGWSAATCLLLAGVFLARRYSGKAVWALPAAALVELFVFAGPFTPTFELPMTRPGELRQFLPTLPADSRVVNHPAYDMGMAAETRAWDIWGRDSFVLRRYAELFYHTQGLDLNRLANYEEYNFRQMHRLLPMLRCRYVLTTGLDPLTNRQVTQAANIGGDPLPRLLLVGKRQVVTGRDEIFAAMDDASFDPRDKVILEQPPDPSPAGVVAGTVRLGDSSTDHLTIEADLQAPAILLVTDAYSRNWRIRGLGDSARQAYRILPANYALRAVPLTAGRHHFRMEYLPRGFVVGKWISIASIAAWAAFALGLWLQRRRRTRLVQR